MITEQQNIYADWSLEQLATEANEAAGTAERQAKAAETNKRQAGLMLIAAKAQLKHGEWSQWLADNWEHSHQWATDCMRAAGHRTKQNESDFHFDGDAESENESDFHFDEPAEIPPLSEDTTPVAPSLAAPKAATRKQPPKPTASVQRTAESEPDEMPPDKRILQALDQIARAIDAVTERKQLAVKFRRLADKLDPPEQAARFRPPTVADVAAYCTERGNKVDAEKFSDFYQSKDWKVGRVKMKDWKAAVRNAEKQGWADRDAASSRVRERDWSQFDDE